MPNARHTVTPALKMVLCVRHAPETFFWPPIRNVSRLVPKDSTRTSRLESAWHVTSRVQRVSGRDRASVDSVKLIPSTMKGHALIGVPADSLQTWVKIKYFTLVNY